MSPLQRERHDHVEILRLDRPQQRNAMDTALLEELLRHMDEAESDPDVRALVFSTTDVRALSAGADVAEALDATGGVARMELFTRLYTAIGETPLATVAVCVGNCVGAGAELAAGCDIRVAGENLKARWVGGLHGVPVGPARLVPLVGLSRAKELILTGRVVGAREALEIGFAHEITAEEDAERRALAVATAIAERSRESIASTKRLFRDLDRSAERVARENDMLMAFQREGAGLPRRSGETGVPGNSSQ